MISFWLPICAWQPDEGESLMKKLLDILFCKLLKKMEPQSDTMDSGRQWRLSILYFSGILAVEASGVDTNGI